MLERFSALILIIILLPFMVLIAAGIYISSGSPIFFKQKRYGYNFKEFEILKFRTMQLNNGSQITRHHDQRITRIGKILRKLKLDEIPQLMNIIRGEMVFIGPRPEAVGIVNNHRDYFTYLSLIKPGISDINSIIFKDESNLFKNVDINTYKEGILPVKSQLAIITANNQNMIQKSIIILLSILAVIYHKLSLRIISRFFLPLDETEIRIKLNNLFSEQIF